MTQVVSSVRQFISFTTLGDLGVLGSELKLSVDPTLSFQKS